MANWMIKAYKGRDMLPAAANSESQAKALAEHMIKEGYGYVEVYQRSGNSAGFKLVQELFQD